MMNEAGACGPVCYHVQDGPGWPGARSGSVESNKGWVRGGILLSCMANSRMIIDPCAPTSPQCRDGAGRVSSTRRGGLYAMNLMRMDLCAIISRIILVGQVLGRVLSSRAGLGLGKLVHVDQERRGKNRLDAHHLSSWILRNFSPKHAGKVVASPLPDDRVFVFFQ